MTYDQAIKRVEEIVHELEQGKETVRLDKVNQALAMFGMEAVPGRKDE